MDALWAVTQDPREHQRWDLRFTEISYEAPPEDGGPQTFTYALQIGPAARPLLRIVGTGRTLGEVSRPDGTRTSALGFGSTDPRSLIREGSGWWRYVPEGGGVRFLTGYDYQPGWGRAGPVLDRAFRPLLGWATAWSFDRLRLWVDEGVTPSKALRRGLLDVTLRITAAALLWRRRPLLVLAVLLAPPIPGAPRASRCLREPPDPSSTTALAPDTISSVQTRSGS